MIIDSIAGVPLFVTFPSAYPILYQCSMNICNGDLIEYNLEFISSKRQPDPESALLQTRYTRIIITDDMARHFSSLDTLTH